MKIMKIKNVCLFDINGCPKWGIRFPQSIIDNYAKYSLSTVLASYMNENAKILGAYHYYGEAKDICKITNIKLKNSCIYGDLLISSTDLGIKLQRMLKNNDLYIIFLSDNYYKVMERDDSANNNYGVWTYLGDREDGHHNMGFSILFHNTTTLNSNICAINEYKSKTNKATIADVKPMGKNLGLIYRLCGDDSEK